MKHLTIPAFAALALILFPGVGQAAGTLYVDASGDCGGSSPCYLHPQDAVNAADPGDTILVYPGTYDSRYIICDQDHPTWCAPNDNWAPALIVYKDNLTIKSVDGPASTIIQSTHTFWSNAIAVQHSTAGGISGISGWAPNAAVIVANNVTIEGFTFHRPFNCSATNDCFWNTAGVFIGSNGAGYTNFLGHANGGTVQNNIFSNVWHGVYIWHSKDNVIRNNTIAALGNTGHWAAISSYDGWDDTSSALQPQSINNSFADNNIADKGISLGAWAPANWTSNADSRVCSNTITQVRVAYSHGPVIIGCNTGSFSQTSTDNVLRITGISYTGDTGVFPAGTAINLSAQLASDGSSDGSGVSIVFNLTSDYDAKTVESTSIDGGTASATATGLLPGVYKVEAKVSVCDSCSFSDAQYLTIYDPAGGFVTGGGWFDSPRGASRSYSDVFFNGFETNTAGWLVSGDETIQRVQSGSDGIISAAGGFHADVTGDSSVNHYGPYTFWDGSHSTFPVGGYITKIDIYLNVIGGYSNDTRFDWSSAIYRPDGNHRRDFVFNAGFYNDGGEPGAGTNRFVISASNNATRSGAYPANPGRDPIAITASGWYTFQHRFSDSGNGVLAVDLSILDSSGNLVHQWTLSDPTDIIGTTVGGNGYGWLVIMELPFLAIDNTVREEYLGGRANFGFVSKYLKGASVPTGNTEFQFQAAGLNFHSNTYEWLVVNQQGTNAQFKGTGTINGEGSYKFILWAGDGSPTGGPDTFRIKIWTGDDIETVVYDNGAAQVIGGGSIVIHKK